MKLRNIRRILGLIILIISLAILIWGLLPGTVGVQSIPIKPEDMQLPLGTSCLLWGGLL